jgi:1-deoxy-D-xylulose-5-phosphate synthase
MNEAELRNLMYTVQLDEAQVDHPFVVRYPRGQGVIPEPDWRTPFERIEVGKGRKLTDGERLAILTLGHPGNFAQEALRELNQQGIYPAHYDMRFVKPLDDQLLHEVFSNYERVLTVEDGCRMGGFGSAVLEWMMEHGYYRPVKRMGIPDEVIEQGDQPDLWRHVGIDAQGIRATVLDWIGAEVQA